MNKVIIILLHMFCHFVELQADTLITNTGRASTQICYRPIDVCSFVRM